ncbi:MAG: hypothetical protein HN855_14555 [Anaerolineae bacterium]|jgi:hypothetical protein|nr:hypothetical protein [Anaerolineae bacterium]MBT7070187.1 hypothetical protein [Anaerolineae bacterium]MBT7326376.1 hypothetical protein [Anaerolineae bacterium]
MQQLIKKISAEPRFAYLLAALACLVYFFTALNLAHSTTSFLDEGLYTYKGWLFAIGKYTPFEEYGLWTNHMPLSFLIPGYIQKIFGPGLRTARYFMIVLGLLTQVGLWIIVRRWSNRWWAAGAVLAFALNPASIKLYTMSISQGIIACMIMWMLVLSLDFKPPLWRILLGAALAGLMISTRLNMAFVLPIFILYIFWQYGFKTAFLSALSGGLTFLLVQSFFMPEILAFWADWLPQSLTPFLDVLRWPTTFTGTPWSESAEPLSTYRVFLYTFLTFRLHFISLFGAVATWLLFPRIKIKALTDRMRAAIFLTVLLVVLFGMHAMNTFGDDRCVSCILLYVTYFDFLGLILLPLAFPFLKKELSKGRITFIFILLITTIIGLGFSAYEEVSLDFAHQVIPYIRDMYLWSALLHVTQIDALILFRILWLALIVGLALVALALTFITLGRRNPANKKYFGNWALALILIVAFLLAPTKAFGKGNDFFNCEGYDVIERYEEQGEYLRSVIPAGSQVYWSGRLDILFLYLPDVEVYPPQLNQIHAYFLGGETDLLLKRGFWNDALATQWLEEADYVLSEVGATQQFEEIAFESGDFTKIGATSSLEKCRAWRAVIEIYERVD